MLGAWYGELYTIRLLEETWTAPMEMPESSGSRIFQNVIFSTVPGDMGASRDSHCDFGGAESVRIHGNSLIPSNVDGQERVPPTIATEYQED